MLHKLYIEAYQCFNKNNDHLFLFCVVATNFTLKKTRERIDYFIFVYGIESNLLHCDLLKLNFGYENEKKFKIYIG